MTAAMTSGKGEPIDHTFHVFTDEDVDETTATLILREMYHELNVIFDRHLLKDVGFEVESRSSATRAEHRIGVVPQASIVDGGASGEIVMEQCMDCGRIFKRHVGFIIKNQPRRIGEQQPARKE